MCLCVCADVLFWTLKMHKDAATINFVIPVQAKTVNSDIHHSISIHAYFFSHQSALISPLTI